MDVITLFHSNPKIKSPYQFQSVVPSFSDFLYLISVSNFNLQTLEFLLMCFVRLVSAVSIPMLAAPDFLRLARPIWCDAIKSILEQYIKNPSELNLENVTRFGKLSTTKVVNSNGKDLLYQALSSWLSKEEMQHEDLKDILSKLSDVTLK